MTSKADQFSLDAKYTQESGRIYLSGIQALVRLPLDQHRADRRRGLNTATFISGYRGFPPARVQHATHAGVGKNGGVLALAGDAPVSKSSTLRSHSEVALYDALMPTIFPGNVQDILDLGLHGFMLSRTSGLWVGVKIVTNVADEAGTAEVSPERVSPIIPTVELDGRRFEHAINVNLIPPYGLDMERTLHHARLELARLYAYENKLNRVTVPTPDAWLRVT